MNQDERQPLFGSWRNFYLAVILWLFIQIIIYAIFTFSYA